MGRYNFSSPFADVADSLTELMTARKAEARQEMLDKYEREDRQQRAEKASEYSRVLKAQNDRAELNDKQVDIQNELSRFSPSEELPEELANRVGTTPGMAGLIKPRGASTTIDEPVAPQMASLENEAPPAVVDGEVTEIPGLPHSLSGATEKPALIPGEAPTRRMTPQERQHQDTQTREADVRARKLAAIDALPDGPRKQMLQDEANLGKTAAAEAYIPKEVPVSPIEKEFKEAEARGFTGTREEYQNKEANRKVQPINIRLNDQGFTPQQQTVFTGLSSSYDRSPLIKAADRTIVLKDAVTNIRKDLSNPANQLTLAYSYIQALDTYQSAVREGELGNLGVLGTRLQSLAVEANKVATSGAFLPPAVAEQIAKASEELVSTINRGATESKKKYRARAKVSGIEKMWGEFEAGFGDSPDAGGGNVEVVRGPDGKLVRK